MNSTGDIAEMAFMLEATKRGYTVFIPFSHDTKVDIIIMKAGEKPITCQVKKATLQKNPPHLTQTWKALLGSAKSSVRVCTEDNPRFTKYQAGAFDVLVMFVQEQDRFVFHKLVDVVGKAGVRWNKKHPSNNWEIFNEL